MPVVPFIDFGSDNETLRNVYRGSGVSVNLPSPPLWFGSATFQSAFVSEFSTLILFSTNANNYEYHAYMYTQSIHIMQISNNGLISFGIRIFTDSTPQLFPIPFNVIAPYWANINLRNKGGVRYATVTRSHPTLSCLLDLTNNFIEDQQKVEFNATWLLVARWIDVCPFDDSSCSEVSIHCFKKVFIYACLKSVTKLPWIFL